jgi:putative ABC transport system ATP-binding protein
LDRKSADEILGILTQLSKEHSKTILMVTHDPMAAERAQATLQLNKGVLVEGVTTTTGSLA